MCLAPIRGETYLLNVANEGCSCCDQILMRQGGRQAWRKDGLDISTTSNEAAKLLDHGILQYISWYNDAQVDGIDGTISKMMAADPEFVMGKVFSTGLTLMGTGDSIQTDPKLADEICQLTARKDTLTLKRELLHVEALELFSEGNWSEAAKIWDTLVEDNPKDLLALKLAHDTYFYLGNATMIRDGPARVLPKWDEKSPLYGYLLGMKSFGLEETCQYKEAMDAANEALTRNRHDAWATHAKAHCYEMQDGAKEGETFMTKTLDDWSPCDMLACHNFWHSALHNIEMGNLEVALTWYDNEIRKRKSSDSMLDIVDAVSLLKRLELQGVNIGDRWGDVWGICSRHAGDHITTFNDTHLLIAMLNSKEDDVDKLKETFRQSQIQSVNTFHNMHDSVDGNLILNGLGTLFELLINSLQTMCALNQRLQRDRGSNELTSLMSTYGIPLTDALVAFEESDFDTTVEIMKQINSNMYKNGGSIAQRDLYQQIFITACLESKVAANHELARSMIHKRLQQKPCSHVNAKLKARLAAHHID